MSNLILAKMSASVTELKKNPMQIVASGEGLPVVILNKSVPVFYCIPAHTFEVLMNKIEDLELNAIAEARKDRPVIKVKLNDL